MTCDHQHTILGVDPSFRLRLLHSFLRHFNPFTMDLGVLRPLPMMKKGKKITITADRLPLSIGRCDICVAQRALSDTPRLAQ